MFEYLTAIFKRTFSATKIQENIEADVMRFVENTINPSHPNQFRDILNDVKKEEAELQQKQNLLFYIERYIGTANEESEVSIENFMQNICPEWESHFDEDFLKMITAYSENRECQSQLRRTIHQKRISINRRRQGIRSDLSDSPAEIKREISSCKNMKNFLNALISGLNNCISKIDEVENSWVKLMEDYDFDK